MRMRFAFCFVLILRNTLWHCIVSCFCWSCLCFEAFHDLVYQSWPCIHRDLTGVTKWTFSESHRLIPALIYSSRKLMRITLGRTMESLAQTSWHTFVPIYSSGGGHRLHRDAPTRSLCLDYGACGPTHSCARRVCRDTHCAHTTSGVCLCRTLGFCATDFGASRYRLHVSLGIWLVCSQSQLPFAFWKSKVFSWCLCTRKMSVSFRIAIRSFTSIIQWFQAIFRIIQWSDTKNSCTLEIEMQCNNGQSFRRYLFSKSICDLTVHTYLADP